MINVKLERIFFDFYSALRVEANLRSIIFDDIKVDYGSRQARISFRIDNNETNISINHKTIDTNISRQLFDVYWSTYIKGLGSAMPQCSATITIVDDKDDDEHPSIDEQIVDIVHHIFSSKRIVFSHIKEQAVETIIQSLPFNHKDIKSICDYVVFTKVSGFKTTKDTFNDIYAHIIETKNCRIDIIINPSISDRYNDNELVIEYRTYNRLLTVERYDIADMWDYVKIINNIFVFMLINTALNGDIELMSKYHSNIVDMILGRDENNAMSKLEFELSDISSYITYDDEYPNSICIECESPNSNHMMFITIDREWDTRIEIYEGNKCIIQRRHHNLYDVPKMIFHDIKTILKKEG